MTEVPYFECLSTQIIIDVLRREGVMDDPLTLEIEERVGEGKEQSRKVLGGQIRHESEEIVVGQVLVDQVDVVGALEHFEELADRRVI